MVRLGLRGQRRKVLRSCVVEPHLQRLACFDRGEALLSSWVSAILLTFLVLQKVKSDQGKLVKSFKHLIANALLHYVSFQHFVWLVHCFEAADKEIKASLAFFSRRVDYVKTMPLKATD